MADSLSENTLTINTEEINNVCSSYKGKVSALGINEIDVTSDFSPLINAGLFHEYLSSLKTTFDKVKNSVTSICGALENFSKEQEIIDQNYSQDDPVRSSSSNSSSNSGTSNSNSGYNGGTSGSNSRSSRSSENEAEEEGTPKLKTEVDNKSLEKLLNDTDFMKSLLSVLNTSGNLLADASKSDYLKELLLLKNISNKEITELLSSFTSEAIRVALYKLATGEIKIDSDKNTDLLDQIKKIVLENINEGKQETTSISPLIEGKYEKSNYTATNGIEIEFYAYVPDNASGESGLPIHLYLNSNSDSTDFNSKSLPSYLNNNQKASGIVICPKLNGTDHYSKEYLEALKELTDEVAKKYNCDASRISVSGTEAGAQASMNIATLYPDYFSKVVCVDNQNSVTDPASMVDGDKTAAVTNLSKNNILELTTKTNNESNAYSAVFYDELKDYGNIDYQYIDDKNDSSSVYKNEFNYNGKTFANLLEYCLAVKKA